MNPRSPLALARRWLTIASVPLVLAGCGPRPADFGLGGGAPVQVQALGRQYEWQYRYAGRDGQFGTADDRETEGDLHLPAGTHVKLRLESADNLYFFGVPALGLKQVAVPEMTYWLEWDTGPAGSFEMLGDQMCGADHPTMRGDLVVESLPAFVDWLADRGVASESTVAQRSR